MGSHVLVMGAVVQERVVRGNQRVVVEGRVVSCNGGGGSGEGGDEGWGGDKG